MVNTTFCRKVKKTNLPPFKVNVDWCECDEKEIEIKNNKNVRIPRELVQLEFDNYE